MFRKSTINTQLDIFSSPAQMMGKRESNQYDDPNAWHNKFYREVTSKVDEDIFKPLFSDGKANGKDGRPNAPIRMLFAMRVLKEGCGCSDESLYEQCRYNLLFRAALGLLNLSDSCPSIDTYYGFYRSLCKYNEEHNVDLFKECFQKITKAQTKEYRISGRSVRMDSKLISSNIAWYSRYEIIQKTFVGSVTRSELESIDDQMIRQQALEFFDEDAAKTVYRTDSDTMGHRLLNLGLVIDNVLGHCGRDEKILLRRVFHEQYEKTDDGTVSVRDKKLVSAKSVQNPNDSEAQYRGKNGKKVKGFCTNITETCDNPGKPNLITDVTVEGTGTADNSYVKDALKESKKVTGDKVEVLLSDGAYQSETNRQLAADPENGFKFVANGIQGKPSRYELSLTDDHNLEVTDKHTGEVIQATPVREEKWKIKITNDEGRTSWRYFGAEQIEKSKARKEVESVPFEERKKRNNVEATIFQYCFHTRNNKTRYRGKIKHMLQAVARCVWINMRRLFLFDARIAAQMA